jgi:hypothetical protein
MPRDYSIGYKFKGDTSGFQKAMGDMNKSINGFKNTISIAARSVVALFSIGAIVSFSKESMKLAAEAEGVKNAYSKLGTVGQKVLGDLTKATRGTIEQSDLMALAIKAQNFGVPLRDLAKLLEFATNRAIQTGGSITELTEKIVQGVGRRAPKSFIALGISANAAKEALSKEGLTGVMELVNAEIAKMGTVSDTAGVRFAAMSASVKDLKEAWGEFLVNSKVVQRVLSGSTTFFQQLADKQLSFFSKMMMSQKQYAAFLEDKKKDLTPEELQYAGKGTMLGEATVVAEVTKETGKALKNIQDYVDQIKAANIEATKQAEAWKIVHSEIAKSAGAAGLKPISTENITLPGFGTKPVLPGLQKFGGEKPIGEVTDELERQMSVANKLTDVFETLFSGLDEGFKGLAESFKQMLIQMAEQMAARAVVFGLMKLLFPASAIFDVGGAMGGGLAKFITGFASGTNFAPGGLSVVGERGPEVVNLPRGSKVTPMTSGMMTVKVDGKIKGRDIILALRRNG